MQVPSRLLSALAVFALALPVGAQDGYGPWEVRRGRTTDSDRAGGYPTWTITFSGPKDSPDVVIDGDPGKARGSILIGRRVVVPEDHLLALGFEYATHCNMDNRSGKWEVVVIGPAAWDAMTAATDTEQVFDSRDRRVCRLGMTVKEFVGEDQPEPIAWAGAGPQALAAMTGRLAGREVILAAVWTALHNSVERAMLKGLRLMTVERVEAIKQVFEELDLEREGLEAVKAAVAAADYPTATAALVRYYRARLDPPVPGDYRRSGKPGISTAAQEEADAALENRFYGQRMYGLTPVAEPIDWRYNPGRDPEWTWQFNRHSAWRALANAYVASGDEKYARKWVALMRDWVAQNPPGTPWSWRTIEAGIRGASWPGIYFSFVESPSFSPEDQVLFLSAAADHAAYLVPRERFHSGSNWGQIESNGLLYLGTFFPEFRDAALWRDTAWERIEGEMFKQVLEDGAQVELTTSYHQGVLSGFIRAAEIAALGGKQPTPAYRARIEKMYEYTMFLQKPDGTQPMLGDSWPGNTRGSVHSGGRRFGREDMLYVGSRGAEGAPPDYLDTALPAAGYYVMRTDWVEPQAVYLLTDIAHRWGGGHQQPDCLQINLYAYGQTLLPDSGSYLYYGPERAAFARTASHSTVTIDDVNQDHSAATCHAFASTEALSYVDGSQQGYPGVTHRRQVLFIRPVDGVLPYVVVIDRITGQGRHAADQYWHFRPGTMAVDAAALTVRTTNTEGPNLLVRGLPNDGLVLEKVASWVSFVYTKKEPRPAVRYRLEGELPSTFVTLLLPYPGTEPPRLEMAALPTGDEEVVAVRVEGPGWTDELYAAPDLRRLDLAGQEVTCRAALVRRRTNGEITRRALVED